MLWKEWFCANESYYQLQSQENPSSIGCNIETAMASYRVVAMNRALLFARLPRGQISVERFSKENDLLAEQLRTWRQSLDPLIADGDHLFHSFQPPQERDPEDIIDPCRPFSVFKGALWTMSIILMHWIALDVMHKYQTVGIFKQQPQPQLEKMALELCRSFEVILFWSESPPDLFIEHKLASDLQCCFCLEIKDM